LAPIEKACRGILTLLLLIVVVRVSMELVTGWAELDKKALLLQAVLPAWLTIGLMPLIYLFALFAAYETAFMRIDWSSKGQKPPLTVKLALLTELNLRTHKVGSFVGVWPAHLALTSSFRDARNAVRELLRAERTGDIDQAGSRAFVSPP
jgi:hypothetical protein